LWNIPPRPVWGFSMLDGRLEHLPRSLPVVGEKEKLKHLAKKNFVKKINNKKSN
jgi:hypothetical protein